MREVVLRRDANITLVHLEFWREIGVYRIHVDGKPEIDRSFEYHTKEEKTEKLAMATEEFNRHRLYV